MVRMLTDGQSALHTVLDLLKRFPNAPFTIEQTERSVEIKPTGENTFPVTIYDQGKESMVTAERWHAHYEDPQQVAWCAFWLLTPYYRVIHEHKGGVLVAIWLERWEETGWEGFEPVYFMNPEDADSWKLVGDETIVHRVIQQNVLPSPVPYHDVSPNAELDVEGLPLESHIGTKMIQMDEAVGPSLF